MQKAPDAEWHPGPFSATYLMRVLLLSAPYS